MIQLNPQPTSKTLLKFYNDYYNSVEKSGSSKYIAIRSFINSSILGRLYNWLEGDISFCLNRGSGRLLEIGCNEGKNLKYYNMNGYDTFGLETNSVAANEAKKMGFKVFNYDLKVLSHDELFDVIVVPNVLEHSLNPYEFLLNIRNHLKRGGELWISLPNFNSIFRIIFRKHWINWHPPFHISQFNLDNLKKLLESTGFIIKQINCISPVQWISMSLISSIFAKPGKPTKTMRNPFILFISMITVKLLLFLPILIINRFNKGDCLKIVTTIY